eukprot:XP_001698418.1 predicted protein [Chlamydomonas reinhardtii]
MNSRHTAGLESIIKPLMMTAGQAMGPDAPSTASAAAATSTEYRNTEITAWAPEPPEAAASVTPPPAGTAGYGAAACPSIAVTSLPPLSSSATAPTSLATDDACSPPPPPPSPPPPHHARHADLSDVPLDVLSSLILPRLPPGHRLDVRAVSRRWAAWVDGGLAPATHINLVMDRKELAAAAAAAAPVAPAVSAAHSAAVAVPSAAAADAAAADCCSRAVGAPGRIAAGIADLLLASSSCVFPMTSAAMRRRLGGGGGYGYGYYGGGGAGGGGGAAGGFQPSYRWHVHTQKLEAGGGSRGRPAAVRNADGTFQLLRSTRSSGVR